MPILTYGAETWTWIMADISRIMAVEMRFLKVLNIKLKGKLI
jgi:uncharacterized protein involved in cysteine biosynthesis